MKLQFNHKVSEPGELLLKHVGEILTIEESDGRLKQMNNDADAPNFYVLQLMHILLLMRQKWVMEARFVNHSCGQNCRTQL